MSSRALERLETLLTGIYDLDVGCRVKDFLVTDRQSLPGECREAPGDEQLFVSAVDDELCMSLYLDPALLERLEANDPSEELNGDNVADCWTALEGISHFLCVAHNAGHDRPVSRLTLEMQAEIDKYVASFALLRRASRDVSGRATRSFSAARASTRCSPPPRAFTDARAGRPRASAPGSSRGCARPAVAMTVRGSGTCAGSIA